MELIKTKSFELAVVTMGTTNAKNLAILIPGRLDTKDYANFHSHAEYLSARGYYVVAFDPPGTWESPGDIATYTTTNYIKAVHELMEYFGNRPTLLIGHSRGGATAMLSHDNSAVIGLVLIMANYGPPTPPSDEAMQKGFQQSYRDLPPGTSKSKEQKEFALPIYYWEDGQRYDPLYALLNCTKPKLLIYGTEDEFTSPEQVRSIYDKALQPKMIKEVISEHDYRYRPAAIKEVNDAIGSFLDSMLNVQA